MSIIVEQLVDTGTFDHPEANLTYDTAGICGPLIELLHPDKPAKTLFNALVGRLCKFFSVTRATLATLDSSRTAVKVPLIWESSGLREGVTLAVPNKNSLMYRALQKGEVTYEPIFQAFPGDLIEGKIITESSACSLVICPLDATFPAQWLISLASPVPFAFDMIYDGHFSEVFQRFGEILTDQRGDIW